MLADISIATDRRAQFDGQIAAVNAQVLNRASLLSIVAFRLLGTASICLAMAGPTVAESATVVSPICAEADLRFITLIEAHGEAQDVAWAILYLVSDAASFVTGQILRPNGGVSMPW